MQKRKAVVSFVITAVLLLALSVQLKATLNTDVVTGSMNSSEASILSGSGTESSTDWWPMFHHDLSHTGYSTSKAPRTNDTLWSSTVSSSYECSSPSVADGRVYVGEPKGGGYIYCFNASTGEQIWRSKSSSNPQEQYISNVGCPAVAEGKVYSGSMWTRHVHCLNASTGEVIWNFTSDNINANFIGCSPAVVDNRVYIGSNYGLYCLNASTGEQIWHHGSYEVSSPAVVDDKLYCKAGNTFYCLNATTGETIWDYLGIGLGSLLCPSSPAVDDGKVYVGGWNGVHCLNVSTGEDLWIFATTSNVDSSPALVDDKVYVGSDNNIYCLNASTGQRLWKYTTGNTIGSCSPAVANGRVFIASHDGKLYCLNALTGDFIWSYEASYDYFEGSLSPAVADDKLYWGSRNGKVYCFGGTLSGTITESDDTTPIVGALVEALQLGDILISSTTTDSGGTYSLTLSEGAYKLRASADNYTPTFRPVVNVVDGSTTTVNMTLDRGHILVYDEFMGTSLNTSNWTPYITGGGSMDFSNATEQPVHFSRMGLSPHGASSRIASKLNASVGSGIIFEGRICPYPYSGSDKHPRGLRAGTDENNAIEFRAGISQYYVEARTAASGVATITSCYLGGQSVGLWSWTYRIEANSSVAKFYINDNLVATHTSNIPTSPLNAYMSAIGGGGNMPISADYLYLAVETSSAVSVYPENIAGPPPKIGETFNIDITIADVQDLYIWQAGMTFNASVLECVSIAEGEFLKKAGVTTLWTPGSINNDTGTLSYSACSITAETLGVTGAGQLMSVTFRVKGSGNSTLHLTDVLLLDHNLVSITPVTIVDGHVEIHTQDISILSVTKSATEAYPTWIVPYNVTVVVENQGTRAETFNVTTYASTIEIGKQEITLAAGANTTLEFNWSLTSVAEGTYTIRAEADVLYGEIDTADNTLIEGTVKIKHPGDANDDSILNAYDLGILAKAWGTRVGQPLYDARADFNGDETIDALDHDILKAYWP
jgi:outer membrane protein assembly factor BamB